MVVLAEVPRLRVPLFIRANYGLNFRLFGTTKRNYHEIANFLTEILIRKTSYFVSKNHIF